MRLSVQMKIIGAPPGALFLEQKIAERKKYEPNSANILSNLR